MERIILAFLISPILCTLLATVWFFILACFEDCQNIPDFLDVSPSIFLVYLGLIPAIPCFFWFRYKRWTAWWHSLLLGIVIGIIISLLLTYWITGFAYYNPRVDPAGMTTLRISAFGQFSVTLIPWSSLCALTFWFIGVRNNPALGAPPPSTE